MEINGSAITFGALGATRMMCPPANMDLELSFMQMLESATSFEIDGNELHLIDDQGVDTTLVGSPSTKVDE